MFRKYSSIENIEDFGKILKNWHWEKFLTFVPNFISFFAIKKKPQMYQGPLEKAILEEKKMIEFSYFWPTVKFKHSRLKLKSMRNYSKIDVQIFYPLFRQTPQKAAF